MKIHVIQHVPFETPAYILDWANHLGYTVTYSELYSQIYFPTVDSFDLLVVMGGPMSTYEENIYPWIVTEKKFIKTSIEVGKKVLGICLGSQLIADVLGAKVYPNQNKEIGWFPVKLHSINKELMNIDDNELFTFHWHGDTFDLPINAVPLASSEATVNQGFVYDNRVFGLQFHPEMTPQAIQNIVAECGNELKKNKYVQTADEISESSKFCSQGNGYMQEILNYLDKI